MFISNSDMKRFLLHSLFWVVFSLPVYIVFICLAGSWLPAWAVKNIAMPSFFPYAFTGTKMKEAETYGPVDILFVGPSTTDYALDVEQLTAAGFRIFNWATQAQSPVQTHYVLKRYLPILKPKLVIYDIAPFTTGDWMLRGDATLNLLLHLYPDWALLKMALQERYVLGLNTWLFYRFSPHGKALDRDARNYPFPLRYVPGGGQRIPIHHFAVPATPHPPDGNFFDPLQKQKFIKNVEMLKEQDIPFVFITVPTTTYHYREVLRQADFEAVLRSFGEYYNFNEIMELDDTFHFADQMHLNTIGSEVFTRTLMDVLQLKERLFSEDFSPDVARFAGEKIKPVYNGPIYSAYPLAETMAEISVSDYAVSVDDAGNAIIRIVLSATNTGDTVWLNDIAYKGCVTVAFYRMVNGERQEAPGRNFFPREVAPGETIEHTVTFVLPQDFAGEWQIGLVNESYFWLADRGMKPAILHLSP